MSTWETYDGPERRRVPRASELEEFYEIIDSYDRRLVALEERTSDSSRKIFITAAADEVFNSVYQEVGKAVLRAALYVCGLGIAVLAAWLFATGKVKI